MKRSLMAWAASILIVASGMVYAAEASEGVQTPPPASSSPAATPPGATDTATVTPPQGSNGPLATPPAASVKMDAPVTPPPSTLSAASAASAPVHDGAPSIDKINTLQTFKSQGADINYLGRKYGLDGWLISRGNNIQVVYTTLDGQGTLVGLLYGPDGTVETGNQLIVAKAHGLNLQHTTLDFSNPSSMSSITSSVDNAGNIANAQMAGTVAPSLTGGVSPSEKIWDRMASSTYLTFGPPTAPILYVFMDPKCHYCHDYFTSLESTYLPQGTVQLRVVPVAILGQDSEQLAEQILSAKDPAKAWSQSEDGDTSGLDTAVAPDTTTKLQQNRTLMTDWKIKGTPGSVYRGKDGKVKLVYGLPENIQQVVSDIAPN
jgi:protein-disulfide isomerase